MLQAIKREFTYLSSVIRLLKGVKDVNSNSENLCIDDIERIVDEHPTRPAFICEHQEWTYQEFENYANQVAHWALAQGYKKADRIAIMATNRLEYVALWYGFGKVGIIPALINYNLTGQSLAHCLNITKTQCILIEHDFKDNWQSASPHIEGAPDIVWAYRTKGAVGKEDFEAQLAKMPSTRPERAHREGIKGGDLALFMYTSGTTGLPKAARITHTRMQYFLRGFAISAQSTKQDRIYIPLPFYHATGGLCGVGIALHAGGAVIIKPHFSASQFWKDIYIHKASLFMYVGELCRFLYTNKQKETQNSEGIDYSRDHNLRSIIGNGLSKDIWEGFCTRFNIKDVIEFYGATEGNISLINIGGPVGSVGRLPLYMRKVLNGTIIGYDIATDTHIKDETGFYKSAKANEIGELIAQIKTDNPRFQFEGYDDESATNSKILRNVFVKGDAWFRTGDLMWRDKASFVYFSDRIGDTFRWKAENVATHEVETCLTRFAGIETANVYGVHIPYMEGRAGMAALTTTNGDIDLQALSAYLQISLAPYAHPLFLRFMPQAQTTTTFKYNKAALLKESFDPSQISDTLYFNHPNGNGYVKLDNKIFAQIQNGELKL